MKKYLLSFVILFVFCFGVAFAGEVNLGNKTAYIPDEYMFINSSNGISTYMNSSTFEAIGIGENSFDNASNIDLDMSSDFMTDLMKQQLAQSNMTVNSSEKLNINGKKIALLRCNSPMFGDVLTAYYAEAGHLYMFMYMKMDMSGQKSVVDYGKGRSLIVSIINSIH
ncbi:hypothetical protein IJJ97_04765 [bacterium]|nr:hypothetical protein [bacterium]